MEEGFSIQTLIQSGLSWSILETPSVLALSSSRVGIHPRKCLSSTGCPVYLPCAMDAASGIEGAMAFGVAPTTTCPDTRFEAKDI